MRAQLRIRLGSIRVLLALNVNVSLTISEQVAVGVKVFQDHNQRDFVSGDFRNVFFSGFERIRLRREILVD
jgi:hypothetical protein